MATNDAWHEKVTASIGGSEQYGKGIDPNPYFLKMAAHERRERMCDVIASLTRKIRMLSEPRFHTGSETSELMEAFITMIGAKQILELGTHTGRSALHFLRAIVGIEGAQVVSIDARPTHDREFFALFEAMGHFLFMEGWTPQCLSQITLKKFDFVFVDSDHSVEHTRKELEALKPITHPGTMICFHDCPEWQTPSNPQPPPVRTYLESLIQKGEFSGMMLPSPAQLDCEEEYGKGYDNRANPGLAVLIRK